MKSLADRIRDAFPTNPVPLADSAVEDTYCVEHLHELLAGKAWDVPTVYEYRCCDDGFSLLTVLGLHYYLPGYLVAELTDPETADVIAESVTFAFAGRSQFSQDRMRLLGLEMTVPQCVVIRDWLLYYESETCSDKHLRGSLATVASWLDSRNN